MDDENKRRFCALPSTGGRQRPLASDLPALRRRAKTEDLPPKSAEKPWLTKLTLALWDWPSWARTWRETRRHEGFGVAVFNRNHERTERADRRAWQGRPFFPANALPEFIASIAKPRAILIMVKAGKPVDDVIEELLPHLEAGDIIIDGGNSLFTDTARR